MTVMDIANGIALDPTYILGCISLASVVTDFLMEYDQALRMVNETMRNDPGNNYVICIPVVISLDF